MGAEKKTVGRKVRNARKMVQEIEGEFKQFDGLKLNAI